MPKLFEVIQYQRCWIKIPTEIFSVFLLLKIFALRGKLPLALASPEYMCLHRELNKLTGIIFGDRQGQKVSKHRLEYEGSGLDFVIKITDSTHLKSNAKTQMQVGRL